MSGSAGKTNSPVKSSSRLATSKSAVSLPKSSNLANAAGASSGTGGANGAASRLQQQYAASPPSSHSASRAALASSRSALQLNQASGSRRPRTTNGIAGADEDGVGNAQNDGRSLGTESGESEEQQVDAVVRALWQGSFA